MSEHEEHSEHSEHHHHHHHHHHRHRRGPGYYIDHIGDVLHDFFRPVRRFFRKLGRSFGNLFGKISDSTERLNDGIADKVGDMAHRSEKRNAEQRQTLGDAYSSGRVPALDHLRLLLMFFMCINLLGFPTSFGSLIKQFCGFAPIAFFILSGYLVLRESENRSARIVRSIKRCAIVFGFMCIGYFLINLLYYRLFDANVFPAFTEWRFWFNFLVLNIWQFEIGSAIWYVQALLYAYIILYFFDKWKLLKFDWLISAILIVFTVMTGELAGLIRWEVMGYNFVPGNFLTRALPYVLLGGFLSRKRHVFARRSRRWYALGIVVGVVLMFAEVYGFALLGIAGYYGHMIGMALVAVSICLLAFTSKSQGNGLTEFLGLSRYHINCIYYFCQPVSVALAAGLAAMDQATIVTSVGYVGIATFAICLLLAWLIALVGRLLKGKKKKNGNETTEISGTAD